MILISWASLALAQSTCNQLPIFPPSKEDVPDIYRVIDEIEQAFVNEHFSKYKNALHPALARPDADLKESFQSTILNFGLRKSRIQRNALFEIHYSPTAEINEVECPIGKIQGVSGPLHQYALVQSFVSDTSHEQKRVVTFYAPVPKGQLKKGQPKNAVGLVMMHAQVWTYQQKGPDALLSEAEKLSPDQPLASYLFAEGARRIFAANPYVLPKELERATQLSKIYESKKPNTELLTKDLKDNKIDWEFLSFTPIFQSTGLEIGAKFRILNEKESFDSQIKKCNQVIPFVLKLEPKMKDHFKGAQCLPFLLNEATDQTPSRGSQFVAW